MMKVIVAMILVAGALGLYVPSAMAATLEQTSFDCNLVSAKSSDVKKWVCGHAELAQLDRKLAYIYQQVQAKTALQDLPLLDSNQQQWARERDACMTQSQAEMCGQTRYQQRIATLQARYQLVPSQGPFTYVCDNVPSTWLVAQFFDTEPNVVRAKVGNDGVLMYQVPSASGAKYQDAEHLLWEHGSELTLRWGKQAAETRCHQKADGIN